MTQPGDLAQAASLLAVDPGLGCVLRGAPGLMRDAILAAVRQGLPEGAPWRKIPSGVSDDRLLGGLDLAATLAAGRPIADRGLMAEANNGMMLAVMAERLSLGTAARLAAVMDTGMLATERDGLSIAAPANFGLIALDEGGPDEAPPKSLMDRLALQLELDGLAAEIPDADPDAIAAARALLPSVDASEEACGAMATTAAALGIYSMRGPLLALRGARAAAALAGRTNIIAEDLELAARLILAPRATQIPAPPEPPPEEPPPPPDDEQEKPPEPENEQNEGPLADQILEAVAALLPPDVLAALTQRGAALRSRSGGDAGQKRKAANRGRPIGSRPGLPRGGARLHVLETLRAAAPWQKLRGAKPGRIAVRRADFRIRRFKQNTRTTTIFVVDASGSAALARLAEAKGAVELLLAECYVRRDRVALLSVRGQGAELLLPPTSSLPRAKKCLAGLPGGGGTPLAAGFTAALALAAGVQREGQTPLVVFLTDGRANIALDGTPGRPKAEEDALQAARAWRAGGHAALIVDTSQRPHPFAKKLAEEAGARYLPLPRADAETLRTAVKAAGGL